MSTHNMFSWRNKKNINEKSALTNAMFYRPRLKENAVLRISVKILSITVFTLSIWTSYKCTFLPYMLKNLNKYNLLPNVVSKNCWIIVAV